MKSIFKRNQSTTKAEADTVTSPASSTIDTNAVPNSIPAELTTRQALLPLILVMILFFLCGFSGGLTQVLNKKFQEVLHLTELQSTGLQISFFAAFVVGPPTFSGWLLRRVGYRWTFSAGLILFAIGTLCFWPSGKFKSFAGFCVSAFIGGTGVATINTAAFPYLSICGPEKYAEMRTNLAEAVQGGANVVALVIAGFVIMNDAPSGALREESTSLDSVQWVYLALGLSTLLLGLITPFMPIPEISDADLEEIKRQRRAAKGEDVISEEKSIWKHHRLFFAIFAAFCWNGVQSGVGTFFINYAVEVKPSMSDKTAAHRLALGQGLYAAGRFIATFALAKVKPRYILLGSATGVLACLSAAMGAKGNAGLAMLNVELFVKSCFFPTLFAGAIKGLGKHTKTASGLLIATIGAGMVFPPAMGAAADKLGTQRALFVPLIGVLLAASYPIYLNLREGMCFGGEHHGDDRCISGHDGEVEVEKGGLQATVTEK